MFIIPWHWSVANFWSILCEEKDLYVRMRKGGVFEDEMENNLANRLFFA